MIRLALLLILLLLLLLSFILSIQYTYLLLLIYHLYMRDLYLSENMKLIHIIMLPQYIKHTEKNNF